MSTSRVTLWARATLAVAVAAIGLGWIAVTWTQRTLERAARESPPELPLAPPACDDASVARLVALFRTFGDVSGVTTLGDEGLVRYSPFADEFPFLVSYPMREWIAWSRTARFDRVAGPPPALEWLADHGRELSEAEQLVPALSDVRCLDRESPLAGKSLSEMRTLAGAHALALARAGDAAGAERALEALWLIESADFHWWTRDWPAIVRHVRPADAERWIARLDALRPRDALADSLEWRTRNFADSVEIVVDNEARYWTSDWRPRWVVRPIAIPLATAHGWHVRWMTAIDVNRLERARAQLSSLSPCDDPAWLASAGAMPRDAEAADWAVKSFLVERDQEIADAITRRVLARSAGIEEPPLPANVCADLPLAERREDDGRLTIEWTGDVHDSAGAFVLRSFTFTAP
jgi:hypothetical protein